MNIITKINNYKKSFVTLLAGLLTFSPTLSFAQQLSGQNIFGSIFTPIAGDKSVHMLGQLFGGLVGNGSADPLLDLITSFNSAILAIGAILIAYTIFAGTINTANEGKFLARFNGAWVPLRTAVAAALVIPVNGYCVMQYIVMWLVLQGVGLADTVWLSLVQGNALQTATIKNNYSNKGNDLYDMANNMFLMGVCLKSNELLNNNIAYWGHTGWGKKETKIGNITNINYGSNQSPATCGTITLIPLPQEGSLINKQSYSGVFSNVSASVSNKFDTSIVKAHNDAIREMSNSMLAEATKFVKAENIANNQYLLTNNGAALSNNFLENAVNIYNTKLNQTIMEAYNNVENTKSIADTASSEGWLMAGAWFMKIANQMSELNAQIMLKPQIRAVTSSSNSEIKKIMDAAKSFAAEKNPKAKELGVVIENNKEGNDTTGNWLGPKMWNAMAEFIGREISGVDFEYLSQQQGVHPIIMMKEMGDKFVNSAFSIIALVIAGVFAGVTISTGASLLSVIPFVGNAAEGIRETYWSAVMSVLIFITPLMFLILGALIGLGFFLGYYIPMLPFLIWIGALLGWFIMVIEAIIAAPLWAVMHLHPNGDDVTGRGGQGYMLVLGLLVRPTLMIFGFAAAIILSMVFGDFLNSIFYEVFKMSRGDDHIGFIGILFATVLYTTMMLTFIKKMFDMIHIIPDQLLQWIGGGGPQLGGYAGAMAQGSEGTFMAAGGYIGKVSQEGIGQSVGTAQRAINNAEVKRGNEARELGGKLGEVNDSLKGLTTANRLASAIGADANSGNHQNKMKEAGRMRDAANALSNTAMGLKNAGLNEGQISKATGAGVAAMAQAKSSNPDITDPALNEIGQKAMAENAIKQAFPSANETTLGAMKNAFANQADAGDASNVSGFFAHMKKAEQAFGDVNSDGMQNYLAASNDFASNLSEQTKGAEKGVANGKDLSNPENVKGMVADAMKSASGNNRFNANSTTLSGGAGGHSGLNNAISQYSSIVGSAQRQGTPASMKSAVNNKTLAMHGSNAILAQMIAEKSSSPTNTESPESGGHSVSGSSQTTVSEVKESGPEQLKPTTVSEVKESGPAQSGGGSRINPSETDSN